MADTTTANDAAGSYGVVFYILRDWARYHRRPMIEAFAQNAEPAGRILVVEPPFCLPLHLATSPDRARVWIASRRLEQVCRNTWVFRPWTLVPNVLGNASLFRALYRRLVRRQVLRALDELGFPKRARFAYITRPDHERLLGLAGETHLVYECRDDHGHMPADGARAERLERREMGMLDRADLVLATSQVLHNKISSLHRSVHFMPNGVDFDLFSSASTRSLTVPPDLARIPQPRIGYVGSIWPPLDFDLVDHLATSEPGWSLVLIGPSRAVPRAIASRPNVYFLGAKPYEQVPWYLQGIDVAILPRGCNAHTDAMNPLKLWEYMAAGRPVVSTPLKQARILQDVVDIGNDYEGFRMCIQEALTRDHTDRIRRGVSLASRHSWIRTTKVAVRALSKVASAHADSGLNTSEQSQGGGPGPGGTWGGSSIVRCARLRSRSHAES